MRVCLVFVLRVNVFVVNVVIWVFIFLIVFCFFLVNSVGWSCWFCLGIGVLVIFLYVYWLCNFIVVVKVRKEVVG